MLLLLSTLWSTEDRIFHYINSLFYVFIPNQVLHQSTLDPVHSATLFD